MVAQFFGLKLRLLANTFRRSPWQLVGVGISLLYGLGLAGFAVVALAGLRLADAELARGIVVVFGSLVVLGFLLVPLAFGSDDTLDPRRFGLFGIPTTKLAALLALTALIGVPSLAIAIVAVAQIVTWSRGALPVFLAMLCAVLIVLTCVLGARVTTSLAGLLLATRRARDLSGLIALVAVVCISPAIALLANVDWATDGVVVLGRIADVVSWTPLGAVWSAPADAATGEASAGIQKLFIAIGFAAVLWGGWRVLVGRMLVSPHREGHAKTYGGLGWFGRLPTTPLWAVAARSLTYWIRDARYRVQVVIVPIVPMLMIVAFLIGGVYWQNLALLPLPVMCLFLSWSVHNDVAFDNTAVWLHVASHTSGVADRLGRLIPVLLIGVPLIAIGAPVSAALYGDFSVLPSVIGVTSCILLSGLGLSSLLSARFPYPAVRPGDSPFTQPQSTGGSAALVQSIAFFATVLFTVPALIFAGMGLTEHEQWPLLSLLAGLVVGFGVITFGVWLGGRIFERRGPELLAFTLRN